MARMVRKQLYLDEATDRRLAQRAALLGVSQAQLVRIAVDRYLEDGVHRTRDEGHRRLLSAIDEIQALGPVDGTTERSWRREDLYDR
ncbi:MAG: ribbon-helix-helix protein, CopG family [Coriobacteriia bacterium]|nr:ribbon-helix-helix protein, CopG family [Coriobacteriia bacterium]